MEGMIVSMLEEFGQLKPPVVWEGGREARAYTEINLGGRGAKFEL